MLLSTIILFVSPLNKKKLFFIGTTLFIIPSDTHVADLGWHAKKNKNTIDLIFHFVK
jgi:hypothetical protein